MKLCHWMTLGAAFSAGIAAPATLAETRSCQCDCYFSGDCPSGWSCNYGTLTIEDSCFWRTPKPLGSPGSACTDDFGDWGQCDGICTGPGAATAFTDELPVLLKAGVAVWGEAYTTPAVAGGGPIDPTRIAEVEKLPFRSERVPYGLGRMVGELMMLVRGTDFVDLTASQGAFVFGQTRVADLRDQIEKIEAGERAIAALLAEMDAAGGGETLVRQINPSAFDLELLSRVCVADGDPHACVYDRVATMANVLVRDGRDLDDVTIETLIMGSFSPCALKGDFDDDQDVDSRDYGFMVPCIYGPNVSLPDDPGTTESDDECRMIFDMDGDGDLDLWDVQVFILKRTQPLG